MLLDILHPITSFVRDSITSLAGDKTPYVIIGLAVLGGWYIKSRIKTVSDTIIILLFSSVIYLIISYI